MTRDREPTGAGTKERKELSLIGVNAVERRSGILLPGWQEVTAALQGFTTGQFTYSTADGLGFTPHVVDNVYPVDGLVARIQRGVKHSGIGGENYDRDAKDFPWRSRITVRQMPQKEGLLLEISNAEGGPVTGETVEQGLADHLGIDRGIENERVTMKYQPEAGRFRFDFDTIVERLSPMLHLGEHPARERAARVVFHGGRSLGERAARHFKASSGIEFGLGYEGDFTVALKLDYLGFERESYEREGAVFSGSAYGITGDGPTLSFPLLTVGIYRDIFGGRYPAVSSDDKQTMRQMATEVKAAFSR